MAISADPRTRAIHAVAGKIRLRIYNERWTVLPTVVGIARELGVSRFDVVIAALRLLAEEGLVYKSTATQQSERWLINKPGIPQGARFAETLAERIEHRQWTELPTVGQLAKEFRTGAQTVKAAMAILAERGLVYKDDKAGGRYGRWFLRTPDGGTRPTRFEQLVEQFRTEITSGAWTEVPKVWDLQQQYNPSELVVAALRQLAEEGLLVKRAGATARGAGVRWVLTASIDPDAPEHRLCRIEGCGRRHKSNGLCGMHEFRRRKYGSTELPPKPVKRCSVDGCDRRYYGKGWCRLHYYRVYDTGSTELRPRERQSSRPCSVSGCDRMAKTRGMCNMHYKRVWKYGSVGGAAPMRRDSERG